MWSAFLKICKYEIYKYPRMTDDKMRIRKYENKAIRETKKGTAELMGIKPATLVTPATQTIPYHTIPSHPFLSYPVLSPPTHTYPAQQMLDSLDISSVL
jgi:hypothetical protein